MMPYRLQYGLSIAVGVIVIFLGAIQTADPVALGIPRTAANWIPILLAGLGGLGLFLPKITRPPSDDRVGLD